MSDAAFWLLVYPGVPVLMWLVFVTLPRWLWRKHEDRQIRERKAAMFRRLEGGARFCPHDGAPCGGVYPCTCLTAAAARAAESRAAGGAD